MAVEVDLSSLFHPFDEAAGFLARTFLIESDLRREISGISAALASPVPTQQLVVALYFLRGQVRSQFSGHWLLDRVEKDPTFSGWFSADSARKAEFQKLKKAVENVYPLVKACRDNIGAHAEWSVSQAVLALAKEGMKARFADADHKSSRSEEQLEDGVAAIVMGSVFAEAYRSCDKNRAAFGEEKALDGVIKELYAPAGALLTLLRHRGVRFIVNEFDRLESDVKIGLA